LPTISSLVFMSLVDESVVSRISGIHDPQTNRRRPHQVLPD
jgi:hypothetical protein